MRLFVDGTMQDYTMYFKTYTEHNSVIRYQSHQDENLTSNQVLLWADNLCLQCALVVIPKSSDELFFTKIKQFNCKEILELSLQ